MDLFTESDGIGTSHLSLLSNEGVGKRKNRSRETGTGADRMNGIGYLISAIVTLLAFLKSAICFWTVSASLISGR